MKSVLVTGAGGYIGRMTIQNLIGHTALIRKIIAFDVKPFPGHAGEDKIISIQGDIRSGQIHDLIREHQIDTVIHLASIVNPGKNHDRAFAYSVDVEGTRNLLEACVKNNVRQFVVTSSGAAYGYHRDNPCWISETDALRGNYAFPYSYHKRLVEELLAEYRQTHPGMQQLILRPGTILGENTSNQITDMFKKPFVLGVAGSESPFVFIYDRDVAGIIVQGILHNKSGIYNLAGDGALTLSEIAATLQKPLIRIPAQVLQVIFFLLHSFRLSQYGPGQIDFLRYRPVLSNKLLKEAFGYTPTYTSKEVFDIYIKANGLLKSSSTDNNTQIKQ